MIGNKQEIQNNGGNEEKAALQEHEGIGMFGFLVGFEVGVDSFLEGLVEFVC